MGKHLHIWEASSLQSARALNCMFWAWVKEVNHHCHIRPLSTVAEGYRNACFAACLYTCNISLPTIWCLTCSRQCNNVYSRWCTLDAVLSDDSVDRCLCSVQLLQQQSSILHASIDGFSQLCQPPMLCTSEVSVPLMQWQVAASLSAW